MSWTTYTVYNFADDLHWPELGILLESIDYHEAAGKASFLGSMCEDSLMAAIHFERRFDALMKYVINSQEHPIGKVNKLYLVHYEPCSLLESLGSSQPARISRPLQV